MPKGVRAGMGRMRRCLAGCKPEDSDGVRIYHSAYYEQYGIGCPYIHVMIYSMYLSVLYYATDG